MSAKKENGGELIMDSDFGNSFITVEDEDGNSFELELILTMEHKDGDYALFLPADTDEDDPEYGYIVLSVDEEDGEEVFNSVDDEELLVEVYEKFMEMLFDEDEEEAAE